MFIRVFRRSEDKETLFNTDFISKIEVMYGVLVKDDEYRKISVGEGLNNSEAVKWYRVHIGGDELELIANPDDALAKYIDEIYKNSIKGIVKGNVASDADDDQAPTG